jgi:hypothetical protein
VVKIICLERLVILNISFPINIHLILSAINPNSNKKNENFCRKIIIEAGGIEGRSGTTEARLEADFKTQLF